MTCERYSFVHLKYLRVQLSSVICLYNSEDLLQSMDEQYKRKTICKCNGDTLHFLMGKLIKFIKDIKVQWINREKANWLLNSWHKSVVDSCSSNMVFHLHSMVVRMPLCNTHLIIVMTVELLAMFTSQSWGQWTELFVCKEQSLSLTMSPSSSGGSGF